MRTDPLARISVRARITGVILPALARATRWTTIPITGAAAMGMLALMQRSADGGDPVAGLRLSMVLLAIGCGFLLDDDARISTEASPSPLSFRRSMRFGFGAGILAIVWMSLVWFATQMPAAPADAAARGQELPLARLSIELVAWTLTGIAAASVATRLFAVDRGGTAAAPVLLFVAITLSRLPDRWAMLTSPADPRWAASTRDWLIALAVLATTVALTSRDPASASPRGRIRGRLTRLRHHPT